MKRIRKDDTVLVTCGKDKGKTGKVLSVKGDRVLVEGVNTVKKHVKPNPQAGIEGGIVEKNLTIHISNVMLTDESGKPSRVGFKQEGDKKVRVLKTTGEER